MALLLVVCAAVVADLSAAVRPAAMGGTVRPVDPPEPAAQLNLAAGQSPPAFAGPGLPTDAIASASPGSPDVWFAHSRWWTVLPTRAGPQHIWALAGPTGPWVDTGVLVDDRTFASVQVVFTGKRLFVASTGTRSYLSHGLRLSRFTWISAEGRWDRDQDFPVTLTSEGAAGTRMAVTDDGRVWLARADGDRLLVGSTDAAGQGFGGFAPLPDHIAGAGVGGFDMVAQGDRLRLVWRSRRRDAVGEAVRRDGRWSATSRTVYGVRGDGPIDAAPAGRDPSGELLVVLTTTLGARGTNEFDPSVLVLALGDRRTRVSVAALNRDRIRYPALVVDADAGRVGVVALTGAPSVAKVTQANQAEPKTPDVVTEKWADIHDLSFGTGPGQVVMAAAPSPVDLVAPLVPADPVNVVTGWVLVAAAPDAGEWVTAQRGAPAPEKPPHVEKGPVVLVEDTFEGLRVGGPAPSAWTTTSGSRLAGRVVAGDDSLGRSLEVRARGDGGRSGACRSLPPSERRLLRVRAVVRSVGTGSSSARVVSLRGRGGAVLGMWITRRHQIEWLTPDGRVPTARVVPDGAPLAVTIDVDRTTRRASITVDGAGGPAEATKGLSLAATDAGGFDEICVAPAEGNRSASVRLDELVVTSSD